MCPPSESERALVSGPAGFIGSHVSTTASALGMEVVATDDLSGGFEANVSEGAFFAEGNLRDGDFVKSLRTSTADSSTSITSLLTRQRTLPCGSSLGYQRDARCCQARSGRWPDIRLHG